MKCEGGTRNKVGIEGGSDAGKGVWRRGEGTGWGEAVLIGYVEDTVLCVFFFFFFSLQSFVMSWVAKLISCLFQEVEKKDLDLKVIV